MEFAGEVPNLIRTLGGNLWQVFGAGPIERDSADQLECFIQQNDIPPRSIICLDSPGGSLKGGMELGRAIRAHRLVTNVGRQGEVIDEPPFHGVKVEPGDCYSACTLAFLGGEYRFIGAPTDPDFTDIVLVPLLGPPSPYGVHRFYSPTSPLDGDSAQIMSAQIVQYMRDMDVDPELFSYMTNAGRDEINVVPPADLLRLNVVNNGRKRATWTIESNGGESNGGLYLKGEQYTWRGRNKFLVVCGSKGGILTVMFNPEGHQDKILQDCTAYQLQIDDDRIVMDNDRIFPPYFENGHIVASFGLTSDLVERVASASKVGFFFQKEHDSPTYAGFHSMPATDGARLLRGLIKLVQWHSNN